MPIRPSRPNSKIFEIGMPKTGTTSLGKALGILGFKVKGWTPDLHEEVTQRGFLDNALRTIADYDAFVDGPWHNMDFELLDRRFPGSKFIVLERNDLDWYASMTYQYAEKRREEWFLRMSKENVLNMKRRRYERITGYFSDRPEDLLAMNITDCGHGWETLCRFIGVDVPEGPFPHCNRRPRARI